MNRYAKINNADYLVCDKGYIINTKTGHTQRGSKKKTGYYEVYYRDESGKEHYKSIHRLVALYFIPNPENKSEVNHIDGDKSNNKASNLEWIDRNGNLKHAYETGLRDQDVTARPVIATNINTGEETEFTSIYKAARFFGISQGNICMCCKGLRPYANGYYWRYKEG